MSAAGSFDAAIAGSGTGAPATRRSGTTPAQTGSARSSASSSGGPVRTFAEASSIGSDRIVVARISWSDGTRMRSHRPGATRSTSARIASSFATGSVTAVAVPRRTADR